MNTIGRVFIATLFALIVWFAFGTARAPAHDGDEAPPAPPPKSALKEDPAMRCYRHTRAAVADGNGVVHHASLYSQLALALGIAALQPRCRSAVCNEPAYDCGGVFYDRDGKRMRVPPLPEGAATHDADVKAWQASVEHFYATAYLDSKSRQRLSPGKAQLCVRWADVYFQTHPDPSILQALEMLQNIGGEEMVGQDSTWLKNIVTEGAKKECPVPPALPLSHDSESWVVPTESARTFQRAFRDCGQPDTDHVGGCPHAFDATGTGNQVNAHFVLDAGGPGQTRASFFVGDDNGPPETPQAEDKTPPPEDKTPPPDDKGALDDLLGHMSIGIGVGGGHGHHHDHGPTPSNETPPPPHD